MDPARALFALNDLDKALPRDLARDTSVALSSDLAEALSACRRDNPEIRSEEGMIRFILRDWLTGMGYLGHRDEAESGC